MYCFILFYLAVLATDVESFGGHCSKRIVRRSMKSTSLAAAKESMALSRFSAILVGSTLPFLLNFDAAEIKHNHISFVSVPERASADSTGKVRGACCTAVLRYVDVIFYCSQESLLTIGKGMYSKLGLVSKNTNLSFIRR